MSLRLTSVLSAIARACREEPAPDGAWEMSRTINYPLGLARLKLATRSGQAVHPMGSILLQAFTLADGSSCVKANLAWPDREDAAPVTHVIYSKPGTDWDAEARQIAARWLSPSPAPSLTEVAPATEVASVMSVAAETEEVPELLAAAV
jgi:hypothetical protein